MKASILAVMVFIASLGGCAMFQPVEPITVPQSFPEVGKQAQALVNEANVLLTAVNNVIAGNVSGGIWTKAQAQAYLNKTKGFGVQVDAAQALIDKGEYGKALDSAKLTQSLLLILQREVAAQARKEGMK